MSALAVGVNLSILLNGEPVELLDHLATGVEGQTWWARPLSGEDRTEREIVIRWDDVCQRIPDLSEREINAWRRYGDEA